MQNLEQVIRERAYHLWIADGQPDGNPDGYWLNAQREILTTSLDRPVSDNGFVADKEAVSIATKPAKKPKAAVSKKTKRSAA
jgi:DUF2934 family protein